MLKINFYEKCKVSAKFLDRFIISGIALISVLIVCFAFVSNKDSAVSGEPKELPVQNEVFEEESQPLQNN